MNEEILTIPEVAEFLKLSKSKVYALAQKGQIPTVKIGKNIRIRKSDLDRWIEAHFQEEPLDALFFSKSEMKLMEQKGFERSKKELDG